MKEEIRQKGFIQIPLLIGIIVSIVVVSGVTTGVVLYKQRKLVPLVASVSQILGKAEEILTTGEEETKTEELQKKLQGEAKKLEEESNIEPRIKSEPIPEETNLEEETKPLKTPIEELSQAEQELEQNGQLAENTEKQELPYKVVKVIDGDTIKLENGEVVRYIGIDTPETVHPSKPIQCFSKEASDKNKELVEGKLVKFEKDITDRDKYGRLLRYVWVGDLFVNDELVRQGYAYVYTYPPDVKYNEQFVQAQKEARENNRGLWAGCLEREVVEKIPSLPAEPTLPKKEIICSYNAYNCSDFSTHAEAQKAFDYCGGITNDIHRLDADKDGLACEALP
jgi:micrococcal nuclease